MRQHALTLDSTERGAPEEPNGLRRIRVADRIQYLVARCRGKNVLHLGCSSAGLTERKLHGDLPHAALGRAASTLCGVDIDPHGVAVLESAGYEVFCCDARNVTEYLAGREFEVVVIGNMLDLVEDPAAVLRASRNLLLPSGELIVTIANALSLKNLLLWGAGRDPVHPHSVFASTPGTIKRLVERCGLAVRDIRAFWAGPDCFAEMTLVRRAFHSIGPRVPYVARLADGWIVTASPVVGEGPAQ